MGTISLGNILTGLGIIATICFGAWALYLAKMYSRRVDLTYIEGDCISLIDDITQGISELEILFRKQPIADNLVLLKGYIVNIGKRDIMVEMVEKK